MSLSFSSTSRRGKSVSGTSTILKSPVVRISIQGSKYTIRKIMARMAGVKAISRIVLSVKDVQISFFSSVHILFILLSS